MKNNEVNLTQETESEFGLNSAAAHLAQDEGKFLRCILSFSVQICRIISF